MQHGLPVGKYASGMSSFPLICTIDDSKFIFQFAAQWLTMHE
jgi:hypothetical protein